MFAIYEKLYLLFKEGGCMNKIIFNIFFILTIIYIFLPIESLAYIGPGTGITAIGSLIALFVGIIAAIIGFLWYPIKRLFRKNKTMEPDKIDELEK